MLFGGTSLSNGAAAAAILFMPHGKRYIVSQFMTKVSSEEADYRGLIIGLEKAQKLGISRLQIKGHSEIVFNQVNGLTAVEDQRLLPCYQYVVRLIRNCEQMSLEWISAEQNRPILIVLERCLAENHGKDHQSSPLQPPVSLFSVPEQDEFTSKSLDQLRQMVPDPIRDQIALQWDGNEGHLAEIYRWYLRGLAPELAIRKVQNPANQNQDDEEEEKLPWEGILPLFPELDSPPLSLEGAFTPATLPEAEHLISSCSLTNYPPSKSDSLADALSIQPKISTQAQQIFHLIELLSKEEKSHLAQELVKNPEFVKLMLRALAEQMSTSHGNPS